MLGIVMFGLGVIIVLVALMLAIKAFASDEPGAAVMAVFVGVLFGGGFMLGSSFTSVTTRNVGVVTSWNKPTGEFLDAGAHMIAPWKEVHEMDLAWQTASYNIEVQAAAGTTVGLNVFPRWRIAQEKAPELFQDYKSFEGVVNNLFTTELRNSANMLFSGYNPLTNIDVKTGNPIKTKEQWAAELQADLEKRLAGYVVFDRLAIPTIAPDAKTQEKLNQQVEEFGRGKVLDQQKINAEKEKAITETNAKVDPVARCLEIAEKNGGEPGLCFGGNTGIILNKNK